ncbi:hypothetical protein [Nonomuraea phyllanthi]|uniref:hypothetical protein n=1 Tax=Nonomuraea phyllanthi TaxID=2219224 RepID=UPI001884DEAB|nr:hypothetical protein [Nonomuraea phyllanthi]
MIESEEVWELPRPPKLHPGYFTIDLVGPLDGSTGDGQLARIEAAVKVNSADRPYAVANEYVAARLAYAIGLPVPPGELVQMRDGKPGFLCLMFKPEGKSLPPVIPSELVEQDPSFCSGVILFDMWVRNSIDRHEGNLAYDPAVGGVIFDHDLALLGERYGRAVQDLENAIDQPCADGHCLVPEIKTADHFPMWAERIRLLPADLIRETVTKVYRLGLIKAPERDQLDRFLVFRQGRLLTYLEHCRDLFEHVNDWPLTFGGR